MLVSHFCALVSHCLHFGSFAPTSCNSLLGKPKWFGVWHARPKVVCPHHLWSVLTTFGLVCPHHLWSVLTTFGLWSVLTTFGLVCLHHLLVCPHYLWSGLWFCSFPCAVFLGITNTGIIMYLSNRRKQLFVIV